MIIKAIFNTVTTQWTFETINDDAYADKIEVIIVSDSAKTFVTNIKLGISVSDNDKITQELKWPPQGMRWESTDATPITSMNLDMVIDTNYNITTWASINDTDNKFIGTLDYTKQKPQQPYPSWSWNGVAWTAPIPMPATEGRYYKWDEPSISWLEVTNQIAWSNDYKDPEAKNPQLDK